MEPVYVKRFIKSEADLPKKDGGYLVSWKTDEQEFFVFTYRMNKDFWLKNIDYYFEPVEMPTKDEADDFATLNELAGSEYRGFQKCYNWLLSRLK